MKRIQSAVLSFSVLGLVGCGGSFQNSNIPKSASDISSDDVIDPAVRAANKRWADLAAELRLREDGSEAALKTPSSFFDNTPEARADFSRLSDTLAGEHLKTAEATRCASVESFESIGKAKTINFPIPLLTELDAADWYLMKYKRKSANGETDSTVHGAIVSVPTAAGTWPVIAYAHAGDSGLSVFELAALFADHQKTHIVVAPALPGEPICRSFTSSANKTACDSRGRYFDAVGVSAPYSTDAEDLLAAHDCLTLPTSLQGFPVNAIKKQDAPAPLANGQRVPVSYIMGTSRGGMTALIALAKNTAMLRAKTQNGASAYPQAKFFNCVATNINPMSFTFGEFRVFLESAIKGTAESMPSYTLPTAMQLNELLNEYRQGRIDARETARMLQMRDATFNAGLSLESVRNWKSNGRGSILTMHATLDTKIPISQGLFGGSVFSAINASLMALKQQDPSLPPGVSLSALGTIAQPPHSNDGGVTLREGETMHGDLAWFNSLVGVTTAVSDPSAAADALPAANIFANKKPTEAFKLWLEDTSVGCASAVQ